MKGNKDQYSEYLKQKHAKFALDELVLADIVYQATKDKPKEIERVIAGEVNEVYSVRVRNNNIIVRISRNGGKRFLSEKWAIGKVREMGVPAPEVILVDEFEGKGEKVWVSVENKLPGKPLDKIISSKEMSEEQVKRIVQEAGEILAKIHSVAPLAFGRLDEEGVGNIKSWEAFMLQPLDPGKMESLLKSANNVGIPKEQIKAASRILRESVAVDQGVSPHLLHGDYGPKHILVEGGRVSGIIDFENCKSGDHLYDFAWWSYFGKGRPAIDWLKKGYERNADLPDDFELRLRLGKLRLGMDMVWYYDMEKHDLGISIAKVNLEEDVNYFQT